MPSAVVIYVGPGVPKGIHHLHASHPRRFVPDTPLLLPWCWWYLRLWCCTPRWLVPFINWQ